MTTDRLAFTKGHGTENDFVVVFDERGERELSPSLVRALCDRRGGIGADGLLRAVRAGAIADGAAFEPSLWFMDYRNADGGLAEMCGNGIRLFAAFLEREAGEDFGSGLPIATRGGIRTVTSLGSGRYAVDMGPWQLGAGGEPSVAVRGWKPRLATTVAVPNPHAVIRASADEVAAADLAVPPMVEPPPPAGTNVEVVAVEEPSAGVGHATMRVHERGVGETRSCGTGACAAAIAAREWLGAGAPDVWEIEVPGGRVTVRISDTTTILEGPAVLLADGVVELSALASS